MFISITDFDTAKTGDSHLLITLIDAMGQPKETTRFDITNYNFERWIQDGYLTTEEGVQNTRTCNTLGKMTFQMPMTVQ